jgi:hypothetical protein
MADWLIVHANGGRAADGARVVSEHSLRELHTASAPSGYALGWDTDGPADAPTRLVHSGNLATYSAYQVVLPSSSFSMPGPLRRATSFRAHAGISTRKPPRRSNP